MICAGCGGPETSSGSGLCPACAAGMMRHGLSYQTPITEEDDMADSQKDKILEHLNLFGSIDPVQALQEYGIFRLAARIDELRRDAYEIDTHLVSTINRFGNEVRYGRYVLRRSSARETV
jgi:hypothetical protein